MRFSKWIVTLIIGMNALFCIAVLYINYRGSYVSDALVGAWFSFTTVELWSMARIKGKEIEHTRNCECEEISDGEDMRGDDINGQ